jgi:hypothetical protein
MLNKYINNNCIFFLKKNGKYKYYPTFINNNEILCVINKKQNLGTETNFPKLIGRNEDDILKKLIIFYIAQKKDLKYIKIKGTKNIYYFNQDKIDILYFIIYLQKNYYKLYGKNIITDFKLFFLTGKLFYPKMSNTDHLIALFYQYYRFFLSEKYKINLNDFANYHDSYLYLKKKGYISYYYNKFGPKIIKNYNKLKENITKTDDYKKFIENNKIKILSFKDLNLLKLIDKYVSNKFNKELIKTNFIKLTKNFTKKI